MPPRARAVLVGNPVREAVAAAPAYVAPAAPGTVRVLVVGGSQGARIFTDVAPAALAALPEGARARLAVSHQARPEDKMRARQAYAGAGIAADVESFFADLPARLAAAHLVVCRAGASTCAELTASGRPALLVPYPHATDDHQTANARALAAAGAGWLLPQPEFTAAELGQRLARWLDDPAPLAAAAAAARALGRRDAAERLADFVLRLAPGNGGRAKEAA
jgi:UDP-N-acetylglucosamine--N-acetylmuramyl-(pentapeptide) pyrophosphoryl-undecaprenol N-acetylglucosamine transferase